MQSVDCAVQSVNSITPNDCVTPGGLDDVNCYRTVERYDPQSDEWTEVCSLRSPRGGVGVAPLGKYLYAAGGNDGSASLQTVER